MKLIYLSILSFVTLVSCGSKDAGQVDTNNDQSENEIVEVADTIKLEEEQITYTPLDSIFTPLDSSFTHNQLLVPEGFKIQILFTEKRDKVTKHNGEKYPAKGNHDMVAFLPDSTDENKGWIFVSHETKELMPILETEEALQCFMWKSKKTKLGRSLPIMNT